jgi:Leucine-rich repeat (LRR) protein
MDITWRTKMLSHPFLLKSITEAGRKLLVALSLLILVNISSPVGGGQSAPGAPNEPSAFCDSVNQIPLTECQALEALYNSTNGSGWTHHDGWMDTFTPCSWYGIVCTGGHVSSISLDENLLQGTIPAQLENLSELAYLSMFINQLSGGIPTELCNLSNLYWFDLGDNLLSGSIPACIGGLSNLYGFWAGNNQLGGNLPPELGNLSLLEEIWLQGNQLSGGVPAQFGNLTALRDLRISNNPLSGPLPLSLSNLASLDTFWFDNTGICEPPGATFQAWLSGISDLRRTATACLLVDLPLVER